MITIDFSGHLPRTLFSGRRKGQELRRPIGLDLEIMVKADGTQLITSSFFLGYFGVDTLKTATFHTELGLQSTEELYRAINRAIRGL